MTLPVDVTERFTFHPATIKTGPVHDLVRTKHRELAEWIYDMVPDSRERSLAMTELQKSMMWCNAAVAIYGVDG